MSDTTTTEAADDADAPEKLRLGGMALGNGLLVHGPTHWAAAVRRGDGSIGVASGRKPRLRADFPVGIMGLGVLGERVARAVAQFDFPVRGWSRTPKAVEGVQCFAGPEQFDDFLRASRVLVCLLPLTPGTRDILNARTLGLLQPGGYVINVARGAHLVDEDLLALLASGHLAGATLDVFRTEPLPAQHPLHQVPGVLAAVEADEGVALQQCPRAAFARGPRPEPMRGSGDGRPAEPEPRLGPLEREALTLLLLNLEPALLRLGQPAGVSAEAASYIRGILWGGLPYFAFVVLRQTLQAMSVVRPAAMSIVIGNVVNVLANWSLIFGNLGMPALGVQGSAYATSLSRWMMFLYLAWASRRLLAPYWRGFTGEALRGIASGTVVLSVHVPPEALQASVTVWSA